jgi:streptomycin 6-kinase
MTPPFAIPDIVRRRATNLGEPGLSWLAGLDEEIAALVSEWEITLGPMLEGGSEAFVAEATTPGGRPAILKVGLPGSDSGRQEAKVLRIAEGRGYAEIFRHDEPRRAMLLERLGPRLADLGLSVEAQIRVICETLNLAWRSQPPHARFMTGAEKADSLAAFILELSEALDRPCSERTIDLALTFARRRGAAFGPEHAVLAHGDAHAHNTLRTLEPGQQQFKFIDPDGLFIEPAYDLAISMRAWSAPLLAGDAVALGMDRARLLSSLTGVELTPIWEWGFIERVSTGLLLQQLGQDSSAAECLAVAELWALADAPG